MKPMLPTLTFHPPEKGKWLYEIKYDGFRGTLEWDLNQMQLWSRNGKDLLPQFPEIRAFLAEHIEKAIPYFPLVLDGELVILENQLKANFQRLQQRGRLRSPEKIAKSAAM